MSENGSPLEVCGEQLVELHMAVLRGLTPPSPYISAAVLVFEKNAGVFCCEVGSLSRTRPAESLVLCGAVPTKTAAGSVDLMLTA